MDQSVDHNGPSERADEPASNAQVIPKDNASKANPSPEPDNNKKGDRLDRAMVRWTRVVGVFTAVLAIFGAVQTCAFIQSERAFVAVAALRIVDGLGPDKAVSLAVELKNGGRSQGFVTAFNTTVVFVDDNHQLPPNPEYRPGADLAPGTVLAGLVVNLNSDIKGLDGSPHLVFTSADIAAINDGKFRMYVFGYVRYRDEFSDLFWMPDRINGFCELYNPKGDLKNTMFSNCAERAYTYSH